MTPPSQRQVLGILALLLVAAVVALRWADFLLPAALLGVASSVIIWLTGGGPAASPAALEPLRSAVRRLGEGRRPEAPADASPELRQVFAELEDVADTVTQLRQRETQRQADIDQASRAVSELLPVAGPTLLPEPPSVPISERPSYTGR